MNPCSDESNRLLARLDRLQPAVGRTPLVLLEPAAKLHVKIEGANALAGSTKDRAAFHIFRSGIVAGAIDTTSHVAASSSGNFAMSASLLARALDLPFTAVIDSRTTPAIRRVLEQTAHAVVECADLAARLSTIEVLRQDGFAVLDQYADPSIVSAHRQTGREILSSCPEVQEIFVAVSTGGSAAGIAAAVRADRPDGVRVRPVDIEGSAIFASPGTELPSRTIPGIGAARRFPLVDLAGIAKDDVVIVSESEAEQGNKALLNRGVYAGGSSGAVFSAALREGGGGPVVAVLADRGASYAG